MLGDVRKVREEKGEGRDDREGGDRGETWQVNI